MCAHLSLVVYLLPCGWEGSGLEGGSVMDCDYSWLTAWENLVNLVKTQVPPQ